MAARVLTHGHILTTNWQEKANAALRVDKGQAPADRSFVDKYIFVHGSSNLWLFIIIIILNINIMVYNLVSSSFHMVVSIHGYPQMDGL